MWPPERESPVAAGGADSADGGVQREQRAGPGRPGKPLEGRDPAAPSGQLPPRGGTTAYTARKALC